VTPVLTTRQRQNAASVRSHGVELEADWRPTPQWSVSGQLTTTSAGFTGGAAGLDGFDVPQVPKYQGALSVRFRSALCHGDGPDALRRPQFEDDRNTLVLDDAASLTSSPAARLPAASPRVFVGVENLFDTEVRSAARQSCRSACRTARRRARVLAVSRDRRHRQGRRLSTTALAPAGQPACARSSATVRTGWLMRHQ
jgi:outer membrane receptor protein involved in Fe transport